MLDPASRFFLHSSESNSRLFVCNNVWRMKARWKLNFFKKWTKSADLNVIIWILYFSLNFFAIGNFLASKSGSVATRRDMFLWISWFKDCWTASCLEVSCTTSSTACTGWAPLTRMAECSVSAISCSTLPSGLLLEARRLRFADWVDNRASLGGLLPLSRSFCCRVTSRDTMGTQLEGSVPCHGWLPTFIVDSMLPILLNLKEKSSMKKSMNSTLSIQ